MSDVIRVVAEEVKPRIDSGTALLVCAYDSEEKFQANHLEGAISLSDFKEKVATLDKETELVFYCG